MTLTKLRAKLERREERKYFDCKRFGHLACNYRNKKEVEKRKSTSYNKFKVVANRVIRYDIRKEMKVKRQEKKKLQCFRYWKIKYFKWEYSMTVVEKKR